MKRIVLGLLAATALCLPALAADIKPALLYDLGGKFDKSFNEAAFNGAEKFKTETGIEYVEFEVSNASQREQALRRFAEDGRNPIVMTGFSWAESLDKVATDFPDTQFAIVDMVVDKPNIRSIVFKEQEGSYLVGLLAGMASQTKKVGFIGGMDIPLIRRFGCGYVGGAKAAGATDVIQNMTGDTPAAWNDPTKGGEIAKTQIDQGADVIYAAAGGTGVGVLQAAADAGKLGIGVEFEPERAAARQGADLDVETCRHRGPRRLHGRQGRQAGTAASTISASRKAASTMPSMKTTRT